MSEPSRIGQSLTGWFEPDVTREHVCECGRTFTQLKLAFAFVERYAKLYGEAAANTLVKTEIPDGWAPGHCPSCERFRIAKSARANDPISFHDIRLRPHLNDEQRFAANMARLFGVYNRPHDGATVQAYWKALEWKMTDADFEASVIAAIGTEKKWPTAATLASLVKAA